MTLTELNGLHQHKLISIDQFAICLVDGKTRKEISDLYPGRANGAYYLSKFNRYLKDMHQIDIKDYCIRYGGIEWPKCPGTGKDVPYKTECGQGLILKRYAKGGLRKGNNPKFRAFCDRIAAERRGEGNPMFGERPWNEGLSATTDKRVAENVKALLAAPFTIERREKMRQASLGKVRHAMPHSPETREKMRVITAGRWAVGGFNKGTTSIHLKMREFLNGLVLKEPFKEEHQVLYYSLDFAFPQAKVAVECDGDYFHINPKFFPNGPKDAIQRRNAGRDRAKNTFLLNRGWTVIRIWECDINAGTYKDSLLCKLKQSGLLDD